MIAKIKKTNFNLVNIHLTVKNEKETLILYCEGSWTVCQLEYIQDTLKDIVNIHKKNIVFDLMNVQTLDLSGAWLILNQATRLSAKILNENQKFSKLFALVQSVNQPIKQSTPPASKIYNIIEKTGFFTYTLYAKAMALLIFLGNIFVSSYRTIKAPKTFRFRAFLYHVENVGIYSLPIIGITVFLIGIVLAYMGAIQLQKFGAEIYTLDLVTISILREIGILLTSVMIAGRSGSAFTAQIGTMKMNEEVDALIAMGIRPMRSLVLPRIAAMVFVLPLVTFFADIMGIIGGGIMAHTYLETPIPQVFIHIQQSIGQWHFWIGLMKAPLFGFIIAMVSCFHGLSVQSNAESIGNHTTQAVVESIFLIIILDAFFAIFFGEIGI